MSKKTANSHSQGTKGPGLAPHKPPTRLPSVFGQLGRAGRVTGKTRWERWPLLALELALFALCFVWSTPAEARTHAGLCAPTAQSMEAPPPIYPREETYAYECDAPEQRPRGFSATSDSERPLPVIQVSVDAMKAAPSLRSLGGARAPSVRAPFPAEDSSPGVETASRLPRPPRG